MSALIKKNFMKFKLLIVVSCLTIIFLAVPRTFANSNYQIQVEYYFQAEEDIYVLDESKDPYYNPNLNKGDYPEFVGYEIDLDKTTTDGQIHKLYYKHKIYDIVIHGNGGKTLEGETSKVIARVKYADEYRFDMDEYKDLFTREGYELVQFIRDFPSGNLPPDRVIVKKDIQINCMWSSSINYVFVVGGMEYHYSQILGQKMITPHIFHHELFLGWFDETGAEIGNEIVNSTEDKRIYGKYLYDFITITKTEIRIKKNETFKSVSLTSEENSELEFSETNTDYKFVNLTSGYSYQLTVQTEEIDYVVTMKTKSRNHQLFKYQNEIIYDNNYKYYLNDVEVYPSNGRILVHEDLVIKWNGEIIDFANEDIIEITSLDELDIMISNNEAIIKMNDLKECYYFNGFQFEKIKDNIYLYDLTPNSKYYFVYENNEGEYKLAEIRTFEFKIAIYDKKVIFQDMLGYKIVLLNQEYYPNSQDEIILENLESNQKYEIKIFHHGIEEYITYLKTNERITDFSDYKSYKITHNQIDLSELPSEYKFYLKTFYTPVDGKVSIYNLLPNTEYIIECEALNTNIKFEFLRFKTEKTPANLVTKPQEKVEILEIASSYIKFTTNPNYEYSVDRINWYSGNEIKNLQAYENYKLYVRVKETDENEASNSVIYFEFMTLAEEPSIKSFVNLDYTDIYLSFKMLPGYRYYFNNELIHQVEYFEVNNLYGVKTCMLKVVRISDDLEFETMITLRIKGKLIDEEKKFVINKTHNTLRIVKTKSNYTFIIYEQGRLISKTVGNDATLVIEGLESNKYYQIYLFKKADETYFYEEEFSFEIYLPGDIRKVADEYLLAIKKSKNEKFDTLVLNYVNRANEMSNREEYDNLVKILKKEIDRIYAPNYYLWIGIPLLIIGIGVASLLVSLKRKNIKS